MSIILPNGKPGTIIRPFAPMKPVAEANTLQGRKAPRAVEQIAKEKWEKMDDEEKAKVTASFEEVFGKDRATRTAEQWIRLTETYGIGPVLKLEKMTIKQLRAKCGFAGKKSSDLFKSKKK